MKRLSKCHIYAQFEARLEKRKITAPTVVVFAKILQKVTLSVSQEEREGAVAHRQGVERGEDEEAAEHWVLH